MTDYEPQRGRQTSGRSSGGGGSTRSGDYIEVKDRVVEFYSLYPDGRIETSLIHQEVLVRVDVVTRTRDNKQVQVRVPQVEGHVTVQARVYRGPGDATPAGVGHSTMFLPGTTPYTENSELENAETSAVGRALAFAGISAHRGIASMSEILSKRGADPEPEAPPSVTPSGSPRKPRKDADTPATATDPSATPEGKESTPETLPGKATKLSVVPDPEPDPALVDPATGEVVGLTQEQFGDALRAHLIPIKSAHMAWDRLYKDSGIEKADTTPAMRLAVLNDAIAQAKADVPTS